MTLNPANPVRLTRLPDPADFERELRETAEAERDAAVAQRDEAIAQRDAEAAARREAEERLRQLEAQHARHRADS